MSKNLEKSISVDLEFDYDTTIQISKEDFRLMCEHFVIDDNDRDFEYETTVEVSEYLETDIELDEDDMEDLIEHFDHNIEALINENPMSESEVFKFVTNLSKIGDENIRKIFKMLVEWIWI